MSYAQETPAPRGNVLRLDTRAREGAETALSGWRFAIAGLALVILLIPIKRYRLPVELPFNLEVYRLLLLGLLGVFVTSLLTGRGRIAAAGHGKPVFLLAGAAILSQVVNIQDINAAGVQTQSLKSLSFFISFLIVFTLICSTLTRLEEINTVVACIVLGAVVVGIAALVEGRIQYNVFSHLQEWVPVLDFTGEGDAKIRGGRLRVRGSAQHPIALGAVLILIAPLAVYLAKRAPTVVRSRLWLLAALVITAGAVATVSRTVVVMLAAMLIVGMRLRGSSLTRYWPLLLVLVFVTHFAAPGAMRHLYKAFNPRGGLIQEQSTRTNTQGSGRVADIAPGIKRWSQNPIVGKGLGTAATTEDPSALESRPENERVIYDDQYLLTLVSLGIVGFIATIWFVWGGVLKLARAARRTTGRFSDLLVACTASCAAFGASMFTFDAFAFVQVTLVFFIIAALGLRAQELLSEGGALALAAPTAPPKKQFKPVAPEERPPKRARPPAAPAVPAKPPMQTDLDSGAPAMARGAAVNLVGALAGNALAFVVTVVITHSVSPAAIGLVAIGTTVVGLALIPALVGLDTGTIRFVALGASTQDEVAARGSLQTSLLTVAVTSAAFTALIWWQAPWLCEHFFHKPDATDVLRIVTLSLPAFAISRVAMAAVQGFGVMVYSAWLGILRRAIHFAAVVSLVVVIGLDETGLAVAAVIAAWGPCLIALVFLTRVNPRAWRPVPRAWCFARMLNFSAPQVLTGMLFFAILWTDTLLLARYGTESDVGIYHVLVQLLIPATLVSTAVGQMFAPRIAAEDARGDRQALGTMLKRVTHWNTAVSLPFFATLALLSGSLLAIFTDAYTAGAAALTILALGQLANTAAGPLGQVLNMSGRQYLTMTNNALVAALNAGACLLLIPRYGMTGAALATASSLTIVNVIKMLEVRLIFGIHPFRGDSPRAFLAAGVALAVAAPLAFLPAWPSQLIEALVGGVTLFVAYGIALRALGISEEDRELYARGKARLRRRLRLKSLRS